MADEKNATPPPPPAAPVPDDEIIDTEVEVDEVVYEGVDPQYARPRN